MALPLQSTRAQGVTGAELHGTVSTSRGLAIPGALMTLVNSSTGLRMRSVARGQGEFFFDNVPVGGPYRLEARSIGYEPTTISGVTLHLGDRFVRNVVLNSSSARELASVIVRGSNLRDAGAGGPAYSIPGNAIRSLPLLSRDFVGLFAMAPQATGASALSISGQHVRFNAIQVDGASVNDFFGTQITPGAVTGERVVSLETLEEIRVLVAPFDVRQGGFSGGLINAVTRSGTNQLRGSVFSSFTRADLVGRDTAGGRAGDFNVAQYGLSAGGPLIRDKLHFFAVADLQSSRKTFVGPVAGDPATGISENAARRAETVFRDVYGFESGGPGIPSLYTPNGNLFMKLSWQASHNHLMDVTQTLVNGRMDVLQRSVTDRDGWQLSSSGSAQRARSAVTRARVTSSFGSFANEMIASWTTARFRLNSTNHVPVFLVQGDLGNTLLAGGSARGAQDIKTDQRIFELSDNLSWTRGNHQLTVGTQDQLLHFHDNFFLGPWGIWTFSSVDALERRDPSRYEIALPLGPGGPVADYPVTLIAGYVQDRWPITPRVTLTTGLRVDVPFFRAPSRNPALASNVVLGAIDTGIFPNANSVVSPRIGFAWDLGERHDSMLRGGIGGFAGRPLFAWLTGPYVNTGQEQTFLTCGRAQGVPAPTTDITHLPSHCTGTQPAPPLPTINYVDRDFHFQQAIKYALGLDHDFGSRVTGSLDLIHTRTRNTVYLADMNLVERGLNAEGRMMYGASTTSTIHTTRLDSTSFAQVFRFSNISADRSTAVTASLVKRWSTGGELDMGYNWSRAEDVMSLSGNLATVMFGSNPIDGTVAHRKLRRSARDIPHNFVATATLPARFGITTSFFFRARSGAPYAYAIDGDANADSVATNDLAFIPRDSSDITLTNPSAYHALDAFIGSERCLQSQRGRIMTRNSCRNPSVYSLDARVEKSLFIGSQSLELSADLFNLSNMLNHDWGLVRESTAAETKRRFLISSGWDPALNRPRYTVPTSNGQPLLPSRNGVVIDASRWRIQIGARYNF